MGNKIYRIEIWCSDDSCEEFWFDKPLSPFYDNLDEAENELKKYDGLTGRELEIKCEVCSVRKNKPRICEYELL
jgi:hypothetical protein